MKFSTVYASLWRLSNDISTFQAFLHYSLITLGEENVSWRDNRGAGGPLSSTWRFRFWFNKRLKNLTELVIFLKMMTKPLIYDQI